MINTRTPYYNMIFYDKYVVVEANEGVVINNEIVADGLKMIFDHYKGNNFALISHRKNNYTINVDVYTVKLMKKLRALAIVSKNSMVKEKALVEQLAFNQTFAFFENLDDARGWAETVAI